MGTPCIRRRMIENISDLKRNECKDDEGKRS
jgi:hypothetical protein